MTTTGRVEAFSDGVLAIAITLLVLDLRVPPRDALHGFSLAHALAHEWPSYAAYVTSFLVIGIIWLNHHTVFQFVGHVDRVLLFLNLILLMFVAAIPFTTSLLAEYLTAAGRDARTAAVVYSGVMLAMAVAFSLVFGWAATHPALLREGVDPAAARAAIPRFSAGTVFYVGTVAVALFSAPLCLAVHFLLTVYYAFQQISLRGAVI